MGGMIEAFGQTVGEQAVEFDGDQAVRVLEQHARERALAGADFNDEGFPRGTRSGRNAGDETFRCEEMLAEALTHRRLAT
jgi:hypothetical protein